jgi:hypothetical protein
MAEIENQVPGSASAQGEQPRPENVAVGATPAEPVATVEQTEPRPPRAEYEVVASKREEPQSEYMAEHYKQISVEAAAGGVQARGKGQASQARLSEASIERISKFASSQTRVYATIGIGLGLLVGLLAAVLLLHPGATNGPSDMGDVNLTEFGLKGHLATEWKDERLAYHLTMEPGTAAQRAGFLADVNSSPRPLSISIQAKDPFGAVLCGDTILVKYDPRNAPVSGPTGPAPKPGRAAEELATRNEIARGLSLARLEGQELDRERGKTLFQSDIGADGQVASISAQGVLPCTKKQVDRFASWGFTSNFPIVAKPVVSQDVPVDPKANVNTAEIEEAARREALAEKAAAAAKTKKKPLPPLPPIYIEGDDSIVWYDAAAGIVETSAGKAMLLDKTDPVASAIKSRELPISIHYRCDQNGGCTFSALGLGVHHARLKR